MGPQSRPKLPPTGDDAQDILRAHLHSTGNRDALAASDLAGCFHCRSIFAPSRIVDWITEPASGEPTAQCPDCGIDSVLPGNAFYPLTRAFLHAMREHWFG